MHAFIGQYFAGTIEFVSDIVIEIHFCSLFNFSLASEPFIGDEQRIFRIRLDSVEFCSHSMIHECRCVCERRLFVTPHKLTAKTNQRKDEKKNRRIYQTMLCVGCGQLIYIEITSSLTFESIFDSMRKSIVVEWE